MSRTARLLAIAAVIVGLLAVPASAARKPRHNAPVATPACSVSPNPAVQFAGYTISATGLTPGSDVDVYVSDVVGTQWYGDGIVPDSGSLVTGGYASYAGGYRVELWTHPRVALVASCTFTADPG